MNAAERRLREQLGLSEPSLFCTADQQLEEAYDRQGRKIAFRAEEELADAR